MSKYRETYMQNATQSTEWEIAPEDQITHINRELPETSKYNGNPRRYEKLGIQCHQMREDYIEIGRFLSEEAGLKPMSLVEAGCILGSPA